MSVKIKRNIRLVFCGVNTAAIIAAFSVALFMLNMLFSNVYSGYAAISAVFTLTILLLKIDTKHKLVYLVLSVFLPYLGIAVSAFLVTVKRKKTFNEIEKVRLWVDKQPVFVKNEIKTTYFSDAKTCFDDFLSELNNAKSSVEIYSYIFTLGENSAKLFVRLYELLKRGVSVKISTDFFGSGDIRHDGQIIALREAGAEVSVKNKPHFLLFPRDNVRTHAKVCVIDRTLVYLSSANLDDVSLDGNKNCGVKIFANGTDFWRTYEKLWDKKARKEVFIGNNTAAALVESGENLSSVYSSMISKASKSIDIVTPYLSFNESLYNEIANAIKRGVKVTLVLPKTNVFRQKNFIKAYYAKKLSLCGVSVFTYNEAFLHSKMFIVDRSLALLGSSNFDLRSIVAAVESIMVSCENGLIAPLLDDFDDIIKKSERLGGKKIKCNYFKDKLAELLGPLV